MTRYGHLIRVLHGAVSQEVTGTLADMDLTSAQGRIMGYVSHCVQPPCPKDVEDAFHLTHPTVSGLLSRLEKKGLIELRPDADDRRCKRIWILPKGQELHDHIMQAIAESEERIVSGFSEAEKTAFFDLLTRAAENMGCEKYCISVKEDNHR